MVDVSEQARDRPPRRGARLGRHGAGDAGARHRAAPPPRATSSASPASPGSWPPSAPPSSSRSATRSPLSKVAVDLAPDPTPAASRSRPRVATTGPTGVEMEALTAVSVAALTVYDMLKAVDRGMVIGEIRLALKEGGKSGRYEAR